jgi:hypothetical protein
MVGMKDSDEVDWADRLCGIDTDQYTNRPALRQTARAL